MSKDSKKNILVILSVAVVLFAGSGFLAGYYIRGNQQTAPADASHDHGDSEKPQETVWYCSMHPEIRQGEPGKCDICFMDLITLDSASDDLGPLQIEFTESALKLMEVETIEVKRSKVTGDVRLSGKVALDETRVKYITAWTAGRIDRLFVDYTGIEVRKGDHLVELYSPQLLTDQQALLSAVNSVKNSNDGKSSLTSKLLSSNVDAARERLRLQGLSEKQIAEIETAGKPFERITIYSPIGGVVIHKNATEGMYVQTGSKIYTIADMSHLWVELDAYESDLIWLKYGQQVEFTTQAYPGQVFKGIISFIDPLLNEKTRTVKLRVNVDNSDGRLKPEMFVRSVIHSDMSGGAKKIDVSLLGKWVCPMHPEVTSDQNDDCDICGMDLLTVESMGYTASDTGDGEITIPVTAALVTGKRAIVYVQVPGKEKPTFQGRQVVLGPRAGQNYVVVSGLSEGETVVVNGNFKIDSAMQLVAKPSMMSPHDDDQENEFVQKLCPVMGGTINKDVFIEYQGKKVYFCCPGCDAQFKADPDKYIAKLPQFKENDSKLGDDKENEFAQKLCPVMGGAINKDVFIEYQGKKVYFCCPGCDAQFKENPEKYIAKLPQFKKNNK